MKKGLLKTVKITLLLIAVFLIAYIFKGIAIRSYVIYRIERQTGLSLAVRNADISLNGKSLFMDGVYLMNPEGFGEHAMAKMGSIFLAMRPLTFFTKNPIITRAVIDCDTFNVIRNEYGQLNINFIKSLPDKIFPANRIPGNVTKDESLLIEELVVIVKNVRFYDYYSAAQSGKKTEGAKRLYAYTKEIEPDIIEKYPGIIKEYSKVKSFDAVSAVLVETALSAVDIENELDVDLTSLRDFVKEKTEGHVVELKNPPPVPENTVEDFFNAVSKLREQIAKAIRETVTAVFTLGKDSQERR